jgi:hypothetical protein
LKAQKAQTNLLEPVQVGLIEGTCQASLRRAEPFQLEGNTEGVESLLDEEVDRTAKVVSTD